MKNTCLVIGGRFNENPNITYYRVEFVDDNDAPLDLKRNYLYNVVIDEVKADGWPGPWLAYANKPSNIVAKIIEWNDGGLNDITFNGQHYLAVDKNHITLYRMGHGEGHQKTLKAKTNYGRWSIEIPDEYDWLSVSPMEYTGDDTEQIVTVRVKTGKELVAGSGDRSGYFNIVVGNLKKEITVTQLDELEFWIAITDPTSGAPLYNLFFEAGSSLTAPLQQSFRVSWFPSSLQTIGVATSLGTYPFLYAAGSTTDFTASTITDPTIDSDPDSDETRSLDFTIQPPYNIVANERTARLDFSVTLDGQSRTLPIFLHQAIGTPPTYEFSPDGATLTLFANFPHGTTLDGMNTDNIPELAASSNKTKVTKLVIEGDIDPSHLSGIKDRQSILSLSKLSSISLPDFTGAIPDWTTAYDLLTGVFSYARWLKSFEAPLVKTVGNAAFSLCDKLSHLYLPAAQTIGLAAFNSALALPQIDTPAATIGVTAFAGCSGLLTINAPNVTVIEIATFSDCRKLTSVNVPKVRQVGERAFVNCSTLTSLDLPSVRSIGYYAFLDCPMLKTLKLGYAGAISLENLIGSNFGGVLQSMLPYTNPKLM
jgi:hypothetical protein